MNLENRISKTRQDKIRRDKEAGRKMYESYEPRELSMPNINEGYVTQLTIGHKIEFELLEGGSYTLDAGEFYDAFNILFSGEFAELLETINRREKANYTGRKAENLLYSSHSEGKLLTDREGLYDAIHAIRTAGFYQGRSIELKERIIQQCGWPVFIDVCRLYESFTGTPREWVN